jgi:hypothetical protein
MPIDVSLIKAIMATLVAIDGNPATTASIAAEAEIRLSKPLTTQAVDDALAFCLQRGWASKRQDMFKRDVWVVTEAGLSA